MKDLTTLFFNLGAILGGSPGLSGSPGLKGERGVSQPGVPGYPGQKGQRGEPGEIDFNEIKNVQIQCAIIYIAIDFFTFCISGPFGLKGSPGIPGPPGPRSIESFPGPTGDAGLPGLDGQYGKYISLINLDDFVFHSLLFSHFFIFSLYILLYFSMLSFSFFSL